MIDFKEATFVARLAQVSYSKQELVDDELSKINAKFVGFISENGTQALIADGGISRYIVFRGTKRDDAEDDVPGMDVLTDMNVWLTKAYNGKVHLGFRRALDVVWSKVASYFEDRRTVFGGHSLGGALATLAQVRALLKNDRQVTTYTFGAPRVGNYRFVKFFNSMVRHHHRICHKFDPVAYVPFWHWSYRHVDQPVVLDSVGSFFKDLTPLAMAIAFRNKALLRRYARGFHSMDRYIRDLEDLQL